MKIKGYDMTIKNLHIIIMMLSCIPTIATIHSSSPKPTNGLAESLEHYYSNDPTIPKDVLEEAKKIVSDITPGHIGANINDGYYDLTLSPQYDPKTLKTTDYILQFTHTIPKEHLSHLDKKEPINTAYLQYHIDTKGNKLPTENLEIEYLNESPVVSDTNTTHVNPKKIEQTWGGYKEICSRMSVSQVKKLISLCYSNFNTNLNNIYSHFLIRTDSLKVITLSYEHIHNEDRTNKKSYETITITAIPENEKEQTLAHIGRCDKCPKDSYFIINNKESRLSTSSFNNEPDHIRLHKAFNIPLQRFLFPNYIITGAELVAITGVTLVAYALLFKKICQSIVIKKNNVKKKNISITIKEETEPHNN